jgi:hypothetical protein
MTSPTPPQQQRLVQELKQQLRELVAQARNADPGRSLTQQQVADKADVHESVMSNALEDAFPLPTPQVAARIVGTCHRLIHPGLAADEADRKAESWLERWNTIRSLAESQTGSGLETTQSHPAPATTDDGLRTPSKPNRVAHRLRRAPKKIIASATAVIATSVTAFSTGAGQHAVTWLFTSDPPAATGPAIGHTSNITVTTRDGATYFLGAGTCNNDGTFNTDPNDPAVRVYSLSEGGKGGCATLLHWELDKAGNDTGLVTITSSGFDNYLTANRNQPPKIGTMPQAWKLVPQHNKIYEIQLVDQAGETQCLAVTQHPADREAVSLQPCNTDLVSQDWTIATVL